MTKPPRDDVPSTYGARFEKFSADDFLDWFRLQFNNLVGRDRTGMPFSEIPLILRTGDDLTDDLSSLYYSLTEKSQLLFGNALKVLFETLDIRRESDCRILDFIVRIFPKIEYYKILPALSKKFFAETPGETFGASEEMLGPVTEKLRSRALDVAIELSAFSPNSAECLRDIASSDRFRVTAAPTLLLGLCHAEPYELLDHLYRLEPQLVELYNRSKLKSEDVNVKRCRLLSDICDEVSATTLGRVIEFALQKRNWRLAWIGEIFFDSASVEKLLPLESKKILDLLDDLRTRNLSPAAIPRWASLSEGRQQNANFRRHAVEVLSSEEIDTVAEDEVYHSFMSKFAA